LSFNRRVSQDRRIRVDAAFMNLLSPHLSSTARTTSHKDAAKGAEPLCRDVLDALQIPVFGLDAGSKLRLVNKPGEALIRAGCWVTGTGGVLGASSTVLAPHDLTGALNRLRTGLSTTVLLTEGSTRRQAVVTAAPLSNTLRSPSAQSVISGFVWIIPCDAEGGSVRNLGRLFKLTRAEMALLDGLVHGAGLSEAATALHISIHTARTHLKTIFRKTGRRTQSQLLALANRMSMVRLSDDG
jgi:DNA-binding CsgD family transcriptional regulator